MDKRRERKEARERAETKAKLAELISRLPPFDEELDEQEVEHLRTMRALSEEAWKCAMDSAAYMLLSCAERGELAQDLLPPSPKLRLVVNNTRAPL
jgi:hypothetical protein